MLTIILLLIFGLFIGAMFAQRKFKIIEKTETGKKDKSDNPIYETRINYSPIVITIAGLLVILVQPYQIYKIEAGFKGLKVNLLGDKRGVSTIEEVSGLVLYNKYFQEIYEVPLDQRHIDYGKNIIVAKGGFSCDISPSFNYSVKSTAAADMFTNLRTTYKSGGLKEVEQGWLKNAILGAINDVSNTFVIDDIFNNRQKFEMAILEEANKRAGKWFEISQLKTNIQPPPSIRLSIEAKAKAVQDAITSEAQAQAARADAERKIALAKGDSATVVIAALAEAKATKLKQQELTPLYIEYMRIQKWDGQLPSTVTGGNSSSLLNIK